MSIVEIRLKLDLLTKWFSKKTVLKKFRKKPFLP